MPNLTEHYCRCGEVVFERDTAPADTEVPDLRLRIEPWLSALFQSEHLSLLVGSGLTTAVAVATHAPLVTMERQTFGCRHEDRVNEKAKQTATAAGRGGANLEDQLRTAQALIDGLDVLGDAGATTWRDAYSRVLVDLVGKIVAMERGIQKVVNAASPDPSGILDFILSLAHRPPTRNRLEVFTVNYDRLIEHACDLLGIRVLDRFVGAVTPQFRSSRLSIDLHYDPPGMRGEPRYLEGVVRLCKLHGSIDWRFQDGVVVRMPMPFGPSDEVALDARDPFRRLLIYPNAAKDVETSQFPYADLFRDFAASLCRPNVTLVTYGYGFGDDHVNRVIREMLTIGSTHLIVIAFDDCGGRLERFLARAGIQDQVTLLVGPHFGNLGRLARAYLPRAMLEPTRQRALAARDARDSSVAGLAGGGAAPAAAGGS